MVSGISGSSLSSQLFARLDSSSKGYLEKTDLASAFSAISGESSSGVDDLFSALDSDSDGKVTESEFSTTLAKLQEELESNFRQSRMAGGMDHAQGAGGMPPPPPPPPANDAGFSKEELESQLEEIGSTDSQRSSLIEKVIANFEAADADGDGKVTAQEAMAYDQSTQEESASATTSDAATSGANAASSEQQVMFKLIQLMHAYGRQDESVLSSSLSVSA